MRIEIDTEKGNPTEYRAAAAMLLMLSGDIPIPDLKDDEDSTVPAGTPQPPANVIPFPSAPPVPSIPLNVSLAAPMASQPSIAPPAPLPLVLPPPVASAVATPAVAPVPTVVAAVPPAPASPIPTATLASTANNGPVEYDSAGLPWDARIHGKARSKKKDGTWKLQKGLDPAVAQAVIAELSAQRRNGTSPIAGAASLPGGGSVAVPPLPSAPMTPAERVAALNGGQYPVPPPPVSQVPLPPGWENRTIPPAPPIGATNGTIPSDAVPVPPVPVAPVAPPAGVTAYRALMDKLTQAVQARRLDPKDIAPTIQRHGAPNFQELGGPAYAHLIPAIECDFDSLIAGIPVA